MKRSILSIRLGITAFLLVALNNIATGADGQNQPNQRQLVVGVRADAAPFVFLEDNKWKGFLFELCEAILDKTGMDYEWENVTAKNRLLRLEPDAEMPIDILCDPVTVTRDRAKATLFSPILFVSGGSFLKLNQGTEATEAAYNKGWDTWKTQGSALTHDGVRLSYSEQPAPLEAGQTMVKSCEDLHADQIGSIRIGVIEGSTAPQIIATALKATNPPVIKPAPHETVCYREFETHTKGIKHLCDGTPHEDDDGFPLKFYFGDRDILLTYLNIHIGKYGSCPSVTASDTFYSIEPYALGISERVSRAQYIKLQSALLTVFSERKKNEPTKPFILFRKYFDGERPSPSLTAVFTSLFVPNK